MSYGASAYGAASYGGGGTADNRVVFFDLSDTLAVGVNQRYTNFTGNAEFYNIILHMTGLTETEFQAIYRFITVFSRSNEGEAWQQQVAIGQAFDSDTIIGAASFIMVQIENTFTDPLTSEMFIRGEPFVQS